MCANFRFRMSLEEGLSGLLPGNWRWLADADVNLWARPPAQAFFT